MSKAETYNTKNGVKPRYDGQGSAFGALHRDLGPGFLMFDIDRLSATVNTDLEMRYENQVFVEYRLGDRVKFPAIFEYKKHRTARALESLDSTSANGRARIELARLLGARLFVVFADNGNAPFDFYEIDTTTGEYIRHTPPLYQTHAQDATEVKAYWRDVLKISR